MNAVFNPVAMAGARPAKGEREKTKNGVNDYFKSSCEINETSGAPHWLKRSPPAFNRLFNHTRAGSQCGFVLVSRLPAFRELRPQTTAGFCLNIIWASAHQMVPIMHLELSWDGGRGGWSLQKTDGRVIVHFFFVSSWSPSVWDYAAQVLSARSVSSEVSAEGKQDFTPAVTLSLYWSQRIYIFQLFLFFSTTHPLRGTDIDANTMCLFGSLSGSRTTLLSQGRKPQP